jgi:hypothetical protein
MTIVKVSAEGMPKGLVKTKARGLDAIPFVGRSWRRLQGRLAKERMPAAAGGLPRLPAELVEAVASNLSAIDKLHMCLTVSVFTPSLLQAANCDTISQCSQWHGWLLPELYATVTLKSFVRCRDTLIFLSGNQQYCHWIRSLVVRPYDYDWPRWEDTGGSKAAFAAMTSVGDALITLSKSLTRLSYFSWEGTQIAGDNLWKALYTK